MAEHGAPPEGATPSQAIHRIILVDDDEDALKLHGFYLRQAGYAVTERADADGLLDDVLREPPDIVLLDISLPGIGGIEACAQLKRDAGARKTRVIMLTAHTTVGAVQQANAVGADGYLMKPLTKTKLLATVGAFLGQGAASPHVSWWKRANKWFRASPTSR